MNGQQLSHDLTSEDGLPQRARQAYEFLRETMAYNVPESEIEIASHSLEALARCIADAWSLAHEFKRERDKALEDYSQLEQAVLDPDGIIHPLVDDLIERTQSQALKLHHECNAAHIASVMYNEFGWEAKESALLAFLLDNFESGLKKYPMELIPLLGRLVEEMHLEHGED